MRVKLTYFKNSGKYYSEGFYKTSKEELFEIWDEVRSMLSDGIRPGLCDGHSEFHVLVNVLGHKHNLPHLFLGMG